MKKSLLKKIEKFLENKVKITGNDERAKAAADDVSAFKSLILELARAKWEPSYEDWIPVEVVVVNRTTHESFNFRPMPDDLGDEEQLNFKEKMRIAVMNNNMAAESLSRVWNIHELKLRTDKAIEDGRYCRIHGEFLPKGPCPECMKLFKGKKV